MKNQTELEQINKLAATFFHEKQFSLAAKLCDIAAEITDNKIPEILSKAALCYRLAGDFETALNRITLYNQLAVNDSQGLAEQAFYCRWLGRHDESDFILQYLMSESTNRTLSLGWHEMQRGNFKKSIDLTEAGRSGCYWSSDRQLPTVPRLSDTDLTNKKILICGESGAGDEIIFARWLPVLKKRSQTVEYYTNNSLGKIFARQYGITAIDDPKNTSCDYYLPAMSLAYLLQVEEPGASPYLAANPEYIDKWHKILGTTAEPLITVNGTGDLKHPENGYRSIPWQQLGNYFGRVGKLVSVQKTLNEPLPPNILNLSDKIESWEDTLAILSLSATVVTSCTSIAHAAAALGRPTIVLTNQCDYFTWCGTTSGEKSNWYSNAWVIRQKNIGDWTTELSHAAALVAQTLM